MSKRNIVYQEILARFRGGVGGCLKRNFISSSQSLLDSLVTSLDRELELLVVPTFCWALYLHKYSGSLSGKTPKERYFNFLQTKAPTLLKEWPDLKNTLECFVSNEINFIKDIVQKIGSNFTEIQHNFLLNNQMLTDIIFLPSTDRHYNGRRTFVLNFSGKLIKVKPWNFAFCSTIGTILEEFNQEQRSKLIIPKHYLIGDWIFAEYLHPKLKANPAEAQRFYYQAGQWLAFIYVLNGVDFHLENVLASKDKVILLDFETLFTNFSIYQNKILGKLLTSTGFIERKTKDTPLSALTGGDQKIPSLLDPLVLYDETDNMRITYRAISKIKIQNRIKNQGSYWSPSFFTRNILEGFESTYLWFLKEKARILSLVEKTNSPILARVILRKPHFIRS